MTEALDEQWLTMVILQMLKLPAIEIAVEQEMMKRAICGGMSGLIYAELSRECGCDVDDVLELICRDVGYRLHSLVVKVCQLAIDRSWISSRGDAVNV